MAKPQYLSITENMKVGNWLTSHKEEMNGMKRAEIVEALHADTGIRITESKLAKLLKELDIRPRAAKKRSKLAESKYSTNDRFARDAVIVQSIMSIADALGHELPYRAELRAIAARHNLNNPKTGSRVTSNGVPEVPDEEIVKRHTSTEELLSEILRKIHGGTSDA